MRYLNTNIGPAEFLLEWSDSPDGQFEPTEVAWDDFIKDEVGTVRALGWDPDGCLVWDCETEQYEPLVMDDDTPADVQVRNLEAVAGIFGTTLVHGPDGSINLADSGDHDTSLDRALELVFELADLPEGGTRVDSIERFFGDGTGRLLKVGFSGHDESAEPSLPYRGSVAVYDDGSVSIEFNRTALRRET